MIQRIQSLFLLLSSASVSTLFIGSVSFADFTEPSAQMPETADGYLNIYDNPLLLGLTAASIVLFLAGIFLFKNRPRQIQLVWLTLALVVGLLAMAAYQVQQESATMVAKAYAGTLNPTLVGFIPPVLALVLGFLAIRNIRKDELLVRSSDRLR